MACIEWDHVAPRYSLVHDGGRGIWYVIPDGKQREFWSFYNANPDDPPPSWCRPVDILKLRFTDYEV